MNDNQYSVSAYDDKYFNDVIRLWKEQFDEDYVNNRKRLFKWLSGENPNRKDHPTYFLLFDGERVIGMHGYMPLKVSIGGELQQCHMAHDTLLAKESRGKGLGKVILKGITESSEKVAGALWFNYPNFRLYTKFGWTNVPDFYPFVRIYNPKSFLDGKKYNAALKAIIAIGVKTGLSIKNALTSPKDNSNYTIKEIDTFDEQFDALFNELAPKFKIIVERSSSYLNWKFVKKPFSNYMRIAAYDSRSRLAGYMVSKVEKSDDILRGKIIDFMAPPDNPDVFYALLNNCLKKMERLKVAYIQIITSNPGFIRLIKKTGFMQSKNCQKFMVTNWQGTFEKELIADIKNWFLTESDADGDAWVVD